MLVEEPGDVDQARPLVRDQLGSADDPARGVRVNLGPFLDRALVGDHRASIRIHDRHHPIANARRLNVVAPAKGVVHATLHIRLELVHERLVHRPEYRQQERRLRVGAVVTVARADDPDAG